jgi:ketosteroid isomerase-like protein
MSPENVERIREAYRRVNEGGFAAIVDLIDPRFEMDAPQGVESSQAHDKEGLREWFWKMGEIWEELRFDPKEMIELDEERVLAVAHTWARASGSRIEISQDLTHVWTLRDGRVVRLNAYSTKAEALEAVGLPEQGAHAEP